MKTSIWFVAVLVILLGFKVGCLCLSMSAKGKVPGGNGLLPMMLSLLG